MDMGIHFKQMFNSFSETYGPSNTNATEEGASGNMPTPSQLTQEPERTSDSKKQGCLQDDGLCKGKFLQIHELLACACMCVCVCVCASPMAVHAIAIANVRQRTRNRPKQGNSEPQAQRPKWHTKQANETNHAATKQPPGNTK
jgi:hypothetical protein